MSNGTVLSRLAITNWGNSRKSHEIISFSDKSTLITGDNGGGKTTTLDALAVVLYGSASSRNFNIGKDSSSKEKKRSALSYLKGSRKNFNPIRDDIDFIGNIVAEFKDLETGNYFCGGVLFKVSAEETEDIPPEHFFFTLNGKIPEDEFANLSIKELEEIIKNRDNTYANEGPLINKIYSSNNSYSSVLMDKVFGGVDHEMFIKLQKASIAAKMPENSSVEDFIKAYLFTKPENNTCESLIEKSRSIKKMGKILEEKKKLIQELEQICELINEAESLDKKIKEHELVTYNIKALVLSSLLNSTNEEIENLTEEKRNLNSKKLSLEAKNEQAIINIAQTKTSLEQSEYGNKKNLLKIKSIELQQKERDVEEWQSFLDNIKEWFYDDELPVPSAVNSVYEDFCNKKISIEAISSLQRVLKEAHINIYEEYKDALVFKRGIDKKVENLVDELNELKNDVRTYRNINVSKVAKELQNSLRMIYSNNIEVRIFSRTFEIIDQEWKNAIESRLTAKAFLIVDPKYYKIVHQEFKKMDTKGVHLIDSLKMIEKPSTPKKGSLYECVHSSEDYIDAALRYYLGNIIKCLDITDFNNVNIENGIMKDCFTYNQRSSYQPNEEDYTRYASIGLKIPEKVIKLKEEELSRLRNEKDYAYKEYKRLEKASNLNYFESKNPEHLFNIGKSAISVDNLKAKIENLSVEIEILKNGDIKKLEERLKLLKDEKASYEEKLENININIEKNTIAITKAESTKESYEKDINNLEVSDNINIIKKSEEWFVNYQNKHLSVSKITEIRENEIASSKNELSSRKNQLINRKTPLLKANPSYGFDYEWNSNSQFLAIYENEKTKFNESLIEEYEEAYQCALDDLKNCVIDQLNRDIKNAKNHQNRINAQLQRHVFGNNYYKLSISRARSKYGEYYDMLTSSKLDFKVSKSDKNQLDFSDIMLGDEYGKEIASFMDLFVPPEEDDYDGNKARYEEDQKKFKERLEILTDYRTYLKFDLQAFTDTSRLSDLAKRNLRESVSVDSTAGIDSGGEEANAKYIALLMGFAMLYKTPGDRKSKFSLVMMDESFNKMDIKRTKEIINYSNELNLQLVVSVPDKEGYVMKNWFNRMVYFVADKEEYSSIQQIEKKEV